MAIAGRLPSLHHGEAISIGMVFAAWVSVVIGLAQKDLVEDHVGLLAAMGLPTMLAGRPPSWDDVRRYMQMDKKYARGLRLVLLSEAGAPMVQGDIPQAALQEAWRHVTES
jgi:3-dehydroquinate synthetase